MLNQSSSAAVPEDPAEASVPGSLGALYGLLVSPPPSSAPVDVFDDDDLVEEWTEEEIVFLHWRLLKEIADLRDPATPLEEKLDTLRWVFAERDKEGRPFSFVNCLQIIGCSPLSPAPYMGLMDAGEIRESIRRRIRGWLSATVERYPAWVREAVYKNPEWVESRLEKNPQWINEEVKKHSLQGDLFE